MPINSPLQQELILQRSKVAFDATIDSIYLHLVSPVVVPNLVGRNLFRKELALL